MTEYASPTLVVTIHSGYFLWCSWRFLHGDKIGNVIKKEWSDRIKLCTWFDQRQTCGIHTIWVNMSAVVFLFFFQLTCSFLVTCHSFILDDLPFSFQPLRQTTCKSVASSVLVVNQMRNIIEICKLWIFPNDTSSVTFRKQWQTIELSYYPVIHK